VGVSLKKYSLGDYTIASYTAWERAPRDPFILFGGNILASATASQIFITKAITYLAVSAVTSWALKALMPKPDFGAMGSSTGLLSNARTGTGPQEIVYGEIRKGGVVTFVESTGATNKYLHQIICLAGHEVNQIGDVYINDEVEAIGTDHYVSSAKWKDGSGNSKVYIRKFLGADNQNVYSTLSGITDGPAFEVDGSAPSNNEHTNFKGEGIACLYIRLEYDQNVFAEGIPLFTAKVQGKKVYDPRSGSTAYSANAALCIRDYLVSDYGVDNTGDTNDTVFSAAANSCDETVSLSAGGTEKRYEMNGVISLDRSPSDILGDMMTCAAATLFWGQGKWQLKVGEYTSSVKTFTVDDLRSGVTLETKHSRRDNFNIVRGTFNDATEDYIQTDYPEVRSTTFISNDNNVESALDLTLPFTTSSIMAQRLAKMTLFRAREQMTFSADFGLDAFDVQVGDIVGITNSRYGFSNKDFEVVGWKFSNSSSAGDLRVNLTLRETSSAAFSWSAEENAINNNDSTLPSVTANLTIASLTISGGGRTAGDGTFVHSAIVSWTAPTNLFISHYEVEYKVTSDSSFHATQTTETSIEISPLVDALEYTFRVRAVTVKGNKGPYVTATFTGGGDTSAPGLPTSISASGGFKFITINWTNPADSDLNFVEIYENSSNSSSGATKVGNSSGDTFTRTNLGLSQTKYYFLKSVDYSGNKSAFTSSVNATTTYLNDADFENGIRQIFIDGGVDLVEPVTSLPSSGAFTGQTVFLTTDSKLYNWTGSQWVVAAGGAESFSELTGSIAASQIPTGVITEAKIADDAITAGKISANAVGANEIAANAIESAKIAAGVITADKIATGVITGDKLVANTITGGLLATAGIITSAAQITDGIIQNVKIEDAAITAAKIADLAVTSAKIGSLDAAKITAGTLDVDRFPALGQANSTVFSNSLTRNGTAASVTISFSGVKVGASVIVVGQMGGHANNVDSPFLRVTPTATGVTLVSTAYRDIKAKEGSITISGLKEFYPVVMTGTTTATSGSVGFTIQLRGNDSGGGGSQGTVAALILSG